MRINSLVSLCLVCLLGIPSALRAANPGDVIITEFMADPNDVNDTAGEYFEIFNRTNAAIDLLGWDILDNSATHTFIGANGTTVIPARGFLVVGITTNTALNGGVPVQYVWPTMALGNGGDQILLRDTADTQICLATWDDGNDYGAGVAYELKDWNGHTNSVTDHAGTVPALTDYIGATNPIDGAGADLGSPGAAGQTLPVELSAFGLE